MTLEQILSKQRHFKVETGLDPEITDFYMDLEQSDFPYFTSYKFVRNYILDRGKMRWDNFVSKFNLIIEVIDFVMVLLLKITL